MNERIEQLVKEYVDSMIVPEHIDDEEGNDFVITLQTGLGGDVLLSDNGYIDKNHRDESIIWAKDLLNKALCSLVQKVLEISKEEDVKPILGDNKKKDGTTE